MAVIKTQIEVSGQHSEFPGPSIDARSGLLAPDLEELESLAVGAGQ